MKFLIILTLITSLITSAKATEIKDKQLLCVNDQFLYRDYQQYYVLKFENQKLEFFLTDSEIKKEYKPSITDLKIRNQIIFFSILNKDNEIFKNYKLDRRRLLLEEKSPKANSFTNSVFCNEVKDALMELSKVKDEYINKITKNNKI